jgi:succinate dehydrogenase/fumarate reductase flavoprotein subunit
MKDTGYMSRESIIKYVNGRAPDDVYKLIRVVDPTNRAAEEAQKNTQEHQVKEGERKLQETQKVLLYYESELEQMCKGKALQMSQS